MATYNRQIPPNDPPNLRGVQNFPTPIINDQIIEEYVSSQTGDYTPLAYGTLWNNVAHTAFQGTRDGFQLVWEGPVDASGWRYKRVWCNDRIDQTDYNAENISFIDQNPNYPDITRVFVFPRDRYNTGLPDQLGPLAPLTPDDVYNNALMVYEQALNQATPSEISSKYIKVVRRYMVIPGPITTTQDFDTQLDVVVFTDRQLVLSTDVFNPTAPSSNLLTLDMKESVPDTGSQYYKVRVRSYIQDLPETFTMYRTGRYNFPALVFDIFLDIYQWTLTPDRSQVYWYPDMRGEPNVPALFKVETEYFTGEPPPETLFVIPSGNLYYNGTSYNISLNNVLNDAISVSASFVDDAQYGDLVEPHTFSATPLTATAYTALIGTYQTIACDITRWRGNIWLKVTQSLLIV